MVLDHINGIRSDNRLENLRLLCPNCNSQQDTFAGKNILSIALEVPDDMLGDGPQIGVWATVSLRRDGTLVQMDRGGHPTINPEPAGAM